MVCKTVHHRCLPRGCSLYYLGCLVCWLTLHGSLLPRVAVRAWAFYLSLSLFLPPLPCQTLVNVELLRVSQPARVTADAILQFGERVCAEGWPGTLASPLGPRDAAARRVPSIHSDISTWPWHRNSLSSAP
jgi:hypothetical protein